MKTKLLLILLVFIVSCKNNKSSTAGHINFFIGNVLVNNIPAKLNQEIKPGTKVTTGKDSVCDIIFNKKNIIRIKSDSTVILNIDDINKNIELKKGSILNVFKKIHKAKESPFKVKTPTTVIAIRGTSFFVKIENKDNTYICDCNGIISIKTNTTKQIIAKHHKAYRISKINNIINIKRAKMKYHSDKEMEETAKQIGEKINWNLVDSNKD